MRIRKAEIGERNLIGAKVEELRKKLGMKQKELLAQFQVHGVIVNASGLSKIEGQTRSVSDIELMAFAQILNASVLYLLGIQEAK